MWLVRARTHQDLNQEFERMRLPRCDPRHHLACAPRSRRWPSRSPACTSAPAPACMRRRIPEVTANSPGFGTGRSELNEDYGFNSNLAIGYGLGNGFRFEIEGDFMRSDLRHAAGHAVPDRRERHGPHLGRDGQRACSTWMSGCPGCIPISASAPAISGPS